MKKANSSRMQAMQARPRMEPESELLKVAEMVAFSLSFGKRWVSLSVRNFMKVAVARFRELRK